MTNILANYICETNFIIGIFIGLILFLPMFYIIGKCLGWDKDEEYTAEDIIPKLNNRDITIYMHDDEYTDRHLDDDKNTIAFISCNPNNIKSADFYYSLFTNKQIITIRYTDGERVCEYITIITQIKVIDENTLIIYYTVIR